MAPLVICVYQQKSLTCCVPQTPRPGALRVCMQQSTREGRSDPPTMRRLPHFQGLCQTVETLYLAAGQ